MYSSADIRQETFDQLCTGLGLNQPAMMDELKAGGWSEVRKLSVVKQELVGRARGGPGITIVIMTSMVTELSSGPVTPE